jgi:hypothetical protein
MTTQLCYTRGTLIPCALKLESTDESVLDIFAEPTAIVLHLHRRVRYFCKPSELTRPEEIGWNEYVEKMCTAVWWLSPNLEQDSSSRYLEGEIKLAKKLKPTSAMGHFSISVSYSSTIAFWCSTNGVTSVFCCTPSIQSPKFQLG